MIELASIAELEQALDEEGFWGRDDVVADVYLGYGLSQCIRRRGAPSPPEPCPALPLLACSVRQDEETQGPGADRHEDIRVGRWEQSWSEDEYAAAIDTVRAAIARGDVYQVNLVQHNHRIR